jgi:pyruvate dehydrogenase E2 component (dihydrolipoamide acetyltransferase)
VGAIAKKPVVKDDQIVIGERMRVTMSVDHRVIYGLTSAQFLQEFKRVLEHPLTMA